MEYMSTEIRSAREAMTIFKILGIKDVSTERQRKNGTQVFELPIQQMYQSLVPKPLRFACYKSGYVRNVSPYNSSAYQINQTKIVPSGYKDWTRTERKLIPSWEERLIYLAKFIIKNYYQKPTYLINDYVIECLQQERRQANKDREWNNPSGDDIKVIINGHRYNLS
jgi:hypothetical protein